MNRCQDFQTQMLDYVYDLVDDDVRDALRAHVEVCPQCRLALGEAEGQQRLLASAARLEFPAVQFTPPAPEPVVLPLPRAARPPRIAWRRYVAAAAILIALAIPAALGLGYADARRDLKRHEDAVAQLDRERQKLNTRATALEQERLEQFEARRKEVLESHRQPSISGPLQLQQGGVNEYKIAMRDGLNQEVAGRIESVKIIDQQRNKVVYEKKGINTNGSARISLPPNLDADSYSHLGMRVDYIGSDGQTDVLQEDFSLSPATYLTHITTDKPMYQPGETVRFRSLSLERFSLEPAKERLGIRYSMTTPQGAVMEIPQGDIARFAETGSFQGAAVFGPDHKMLRGIGGGEWDIPAHFPGGEYVLTVSEDQNRSPAQTRKFIVNKFRKPRLLTELIFNKRTYGPGDEVLATCKVMKGKEPVRDCKALVSVQVDGKNYDATGKQSATPFELKTDGEGKVLVRFTLPKEIDRGQASVNVAFHDGGSPEPILKPIPIALKKLDIEFYPEGGYFVKHAPTRVYVQARTTLGKPAELKGRLMNDLGDVEAYVETLADDEEPGVNQGMAMFRFIPRPNRQYHLEIDRPTGIAQKEPLKIDEWGVVAMSVPRAVTTSHEPIEVKLRSYDATRRLFVGAYCRGRLFDHERVEAPAGQDITVTLKPTRGVGGVYRVTVFEEEQTGLQRPRLIPRAERLIFRHQRERLNLEVAQTKSRETIVASSIAPKKEAQEQGKSLDLLSSIPGGKMSLTVQARGENQEPIPAVVLIGVVDQSVLKLADEKTARSMPTHFFLMSEVRKPDDLEFADFLLTTHPKASDSLDLLLGTQGWRRFVEQKPGELRERLMEEAETRAILPSTSEVPRVVKARTDQEEKRSIDARLRAEAEKIEAVVAPSRQQIQKEYEDLTRDRTALASSPAYKAAASRVGSYRDFFDLLKRLLPPVLMLFLLIGACLLIAKALKESTRRAVPYVGIGVVCLGVALFLFANLNVKVRHAAQRGAEVEMAGGENVAKLNAEKKQVEFRGLGAEPTAKDVPLVEEGKADRGDAERPFAAQPDLTTAKRPEQVEKSAATGAPTPQPRNAPPPPMMPGWNLGRDDPKGGSGVADKKGDAKPTDDRKMLLDQLDRRTGAEGKGQGNAQPYLARPEEARKNLMTPLKDDETDVQYAAPMKPGFGKDGAKLDQHFRAIRRMQEFAQRDGKEGGQGGGPVMAGYFLREYAHQREGEQKKTKAEIVRQDFTDTVYWHPALVLPDGTVDINFALSDAVTTYQVLVYGHTLDGRVAAAKPFTFDTRLPLALDSAVPNEIAAGDKVILPVTVANGTGSSQNVTVTVTKADNLKELEKLGKTAESGKLSVHPLSTTRQLFKYQPSVQKGQALFEVDGVAAPYADRLSRTFTIVPEGFPFVESRSDLLEGGSAKHDITMPNTWVKGTLKVRLQAFPSTLADLQSGLEGLLREPNGCFEQASTTNYPNVLILSYLKETDQAKPELERKVRELMERGYQKLTSYECQKSGMPKREGYEWFGGSAPPHEALTAYGLLQFRDMARHHEVDRDMLERTRKYLLGRRDGKGGFERNPRSIDSFGRAPDHVTNAYIVWALTESGPGDDIQREIDSLIETAKNSKDPYFLALVANSLINRAKTAQAIPFLKTVAGLQKAEGVVDGATTSITGSGGRDLQIETTSLALLAWLRADPGQFAANIDNASKWIGKQRGGYGAFGSTQSTILALKALIAHAKETKKPREDGVLKLWVNNQLAGEVAFSAKASETLVIEMKEPEPFVQPGKNSVRIEVTGKNQFPYTLTWDYKTLTPASDAKSVVKLATRFDRPKANEGDSVRLTVNVENASDKGQGMAVAIIGLPGGLTLPEDLKQLTEYKELPKDGSRPLISTFEIRGRELILYWRDLAPKQKIEVPIDLSCRVPGEYSGPASRAYLYYNGDHKTWVEPLRIRIDPR